MPSKKYNREILESLLDNCRQLAHEYERRSSIAHGKVRRYVEDHHHNIKAKERDNLITQIGKNSSANHTLYSSILKVFYSMTLISA